MRNFLIINLLILIFLAMPASSRSEEPPKDACVDSRTSTLGFFNGVNNTRKQARANLNAIENDLLAEKPGWKPTRYELFYNQTKGLERDIFETIAQKYMEEKLSDNEIFSFGELYWYMRMADMGIAQELTQGELGEVINEIIKNSASLNEFIKSITGPLNRLLQERFKLMITQAYNGELQADYIMHTGKLAEMLEQNHKLVLVAHSQGNLFANRVYEKVVHNRDSLYPAMDNYIQMVHVAPPTDVLYGPYILNSMDHVINFVGRFFTVPPPNIYLGILSNHSFIGTYLKYYASKSDIYNAIDNQIANIDSYHYDYSLHVQTDIDEKYLPIGVIIFDKNKAFAYDGRYSVSMRCPQVYHDLLEGDYFVKPTGQCYSDDDKIRKPYRSRFIITESQRKQYKKIFDQVIEFPLLPCKEHLDANVRPVIKISIEASKATNPNIKTSVTTY